MSLRARLAASALFSALAFGVITSDGLATSSAYAQNIGQRVVSGTVINDQSAPVSGATVFLRNTKSKSIRSYTSNKDGRFRFAQVNMSDDYDLWAEKDGKKSSAKTVSSWDSRKDVETDLKLK